MNTIFTFRCSNSSRVNRVFAVTLKYFSDSLYVALVAGLQKLFLLLLLFSEVIVPHFIHHFLQLWKFINAYENFVNFIFFIDESDFIFVKILDGKNNAILVEISWFVFIVEETANVARGWL